MGRTSDAKQRLMDAMVELIWTDSYNSTSVDQICARADVKKGSFYHFFDSKTALALEAVQAAWALHLTELDHLFSASKPPLQRLYDCMAFMREEQEQMLAKHGRIPGCPIHSLGSELSSQDNPLKSFLQSCLATYLRYYESAVRDAIAQGDLEDSLGAPIIARILFAFAEGSLVQARIWNDLRYLDGLEDGVRQILNVRQYSIAP